LLKKEEEAFVFVYKTQSNISRLDHFITLSWILKHAQHGHDVDSCTKWFFFFSYYFFSIFFFSTTPMIFLGVFPTSSMA